MPKIELTLSLDDAQRVERALRRGESIHVLTGHIVPDAPTRSRVYSMSPVSPLPVQQVQQRWASGERVEDRDDVQATYPPEALWPYREFTRTRSGGRLSPERWDVLEEQLRQRGFLSVPPVQVTIGRDGVLVTDGNHRLAIARKLKTPVPVRFLFVESIEEARNPDEPRETGRQENPKRPGPKSSAQTPALPHERIRGSRTNAPGTATKEAAAQIRVSEATRAALQSMIDEYVAKYPDAARPTLQQLLAVYRRGAGAFSVSHRPGKTRAQWAFARVRTFLTMLRGGTVKQAYRRADSDLLPLSGLPAKGSK